MIYINDAIQDLQFAQQGNSLVNVYQKSSDIFYTGYVYKMAKDGVVIRTVNDYGISDGLVYLRYVVIQSVDMNSIDVHNMKARIMMADRDDLINVSNQSLMHLTTESNIVKEILGRSYVNNQIIMIYLTSQRAYLEGYIEHMYDDEFVWTVINKFDFESRYTMRVRFDEVDVIEFQGSELTMLSQSQSLLLGDSIPPRTHSLSKVFYPILNDAHDNQSLIEVEAKSDSDYFYIGWVKAINKDFVILKLVDMSGQFGGYVLLSLQKINYISDQSDYLSLVNRMVQINLKNNCFVQPVLNDDRAFDPTEDLLSFLLRQALVMKRLVRVRVIGAPNSVMGQPTEVDESNVTFNPVNDSESNLEKGHSIKLQDIQEVAFDYLGTYLVKQELFVHHWWRKF